MTEAKLQQQPDLVPGRRLLSLAGSGLLVAALGVVVSWWMLRGSSERHAAPRTLSGAAFAAGTPEQTPMETGQRGLALRAEQKRRLTAYGWVDRNAGIARIPIERAMELRAAGAR